MEERFLYELRPVRPVVIGGRVSRVPCSVNLTKDEVIEYMKKCNVYRRFGATNLVKVTGANLDSLHVSKDDATANGIINSATGEINLGIVVEEGNDNPIEQEYHAPEVQVEKEELKQDEADAEDDTNEVSEPVDVVEAAPEESEKEEEETSSEDNVEVAEDQVPNADDATEQNESAPVAAESTPIVISHQNNNGNRQNYQNYNKKNKNRHH